MYGVKYLNSFKENIGFFLYLEEKLIINKTKSIKNLKI